MIANITWVFPYKNVGVVKLLAPDITSKAYNATKATKMAKEAEPVATMKETKPVNCSVVTKLEGSGTPVNDMFTFPALILKYYSAVKDKKK